MPKKKFIVKQVRHTGHPLWRIWTYIRQAVSNPRHRSSYGLAVDFLEDFAEWAAFIEYELGPRPTPKHRLMRIDRTQGWISGNLAWATPLEGGLFDPRAVKLTYRRRTHTILQWSDSTGINRHTIRARYHRGWKDKDILTP